ncbi:MAG: Gfo/Idh/MocA family oxidoreductase [Saprospiraceae bacterium]|nr:Gfo/Idh/MocA family oxidoreductase [Saprospiraceae bacterium]
MKRRQFIETAGKGTLAGFASIMMPALGRETKLRVGLIGAGWYGMVITEAALAVGGVEVIGVCDVDEQHLTESLDKLEQLQGKRPKGYKEYEELLNQKDLQAVFIGTMPHWHALQFIAACEKGLPIYCEKPLSYDVQEGLAMIKAAKNAGNIVQIGFQRRQSEAFKRVKEFIANGDAGEVSMVEAQIHYNPSIPDTTIQSPPQSLDWEMWCGPAPKLEFRPSIGHKSWRLEKAYGNGHLVDWGIHHIDITRVILDLEMPHTFNAKGGLLKLQNQITTPDTLDAAMIFDDVTLKWSHRLWGTGAFDKRFNNGIFFYGEKATVFGSDNKMMVMSNAKDASIQEFEIPTPDTRERHMADFLNAVKHSDKGYLSCPISDAYQSTAMVQLATIAYQTGSEIKWDQDTNTILGNAEASLQLARPYRGKYARPSM